MRLKNILTESASFNKKIKSGLDSYLKDFKEGTPMHQWAVKEILKAALTDANFHSETKKVDSMFPRAKYDGDSKSEKAYQNSVERKGEEIANKAKWDGYEIIDAISFYTSMTIGHPLGQKISSLKENVFTKNKVESKLTLKDALAEAKSDYEVRDTTEIIEKIAKLTDRNDHTTAVIELAKFLNDTKALKLLQAIETIHKIEGSIPMEVSKYRSSILKDLEDKFKSKYGPDAAKELNGAF